MTRLRVFPLTAGQGEEPVAALEHDERGVRVLCERPELALKLRVFFGSAAVDLSRTAAGEALTAERPGTAAHFRRKCAELHQLGLRALP
jgi:hypothetical protein